MKNRQTYLIHTPSGQTLIAEFRWGVSRGRDTYGYNICSLYIDGKKVSSCNGGGYDMKGTSLAKWFSKHEPSTLKSIKPYTIYTKAATERGFDHEQVEGGLYGLTHYRDNAGGPVVRAHMGGSCGIESMQRILEACGYRMEYKG